MKFYLSIAFVLISITLSLAGGWTCQKYHVQIQVSDSTFEGYLLAGDPNYDRIKLNNNDYSFESFARENLITDSFLTIYDTIYSIEYPHFDGYKLTTVLPEDIYRLPIDSISNIELLSINPCQEWTKERNKDNFEYYYAWVGHTMEIGELNKNEIYLLNSEPHLTFSKPYGEYGIFQFCVYNNKITKERVLELFEKFENSIKGTNGKYNYKKFKDAYSTLKESLRQVDVVLFKIEWIA
ncbi:MAG: hypothetical protein RLN88_00025 [Ekhidna sp.]|uniref:hypothetical protein n=1 Tax=Ekhidna sp. TaxID=2608089 RepID=UPI0032EE4150